MASNQTSNYGLSQWEATDQVQRTEFNADNAKIDAALAKTCQPYIISYTGDGNQTRTMEFPGKPLFVLIIGGSCLLSAIRGRDTCHSIYTIQKQHTISVSWGEHSFTLDMQEYLPTYGGNELNTQYHLLALLAMDS